jgi:hypothetical protein
LYCLAISLKKSFIEFSDSAGCVHCGIYRSSYNISYLNSPPIILFYSSSPHSWNRSRFSIYINVYTVFVPYSPTFTISPHPPPTGTNPLDKTCSAFLFSDSVKEKK